MWGGGKPSRLWNQSSGDGCKESKPRAQTKGGRGEQKERDRQHTEQERAQIGQEEGERVTTGSEKGGENEKKKKNNKPSTRV